MTLRLFRCVGPCAFALALASALLVARADSHARSGVPTIVLVQPSGSTVPANLLRFSIRFTGPVDSPVLPKLALSRVGGERIDAPFLEQELWSADGRVLTVLMHPGRVKQGLIAREERGPILSEGDDLMLTLDDRPIKRWRAGPVDERGPVPSAWTLLPVRVATRQPLVVVLDAPIDGLAVDHLAVTDERGRRLSGRARLSDGETRWTFTPDATWRGVTYRLVVRGTLEDPSGNRTGSRFETAVDAPPGPPLDTMREFAPTP